MTSLDDVRATLESARHGYLSTASAEGDPHLQPVVFEVVADSVYIAIDEKPKTTLRLRRLTNIESNPRFALLIDNYDDTWDRLWWILLRGPATVLWPSTWEVEEAEAVIAALRAKYPQYASMALEERPLLKLTPDRITRWSAS
ncbi:MAG: TIGR03668 family PPOX class F420-dependent oxidoreductase [Chloroflexota bacterium]|nr:TIGR03668 family PPOX class F420-dependent oxidoreductase [Chloroflexota bacterium]MDE2896385.1 TIGR03668 family PPOX class F420-dependent oxidoreductase [Chloroflexota bacterium]